MLKKEKINSYAFRTSGIPIFSLTGLDFAFLLSFIILTLDYDH